MLVIERRYSDRPEDIKYTIDVFLFLLEKLHGFSVKKTSQKATESEKNTRPRYLDLKR